MFGPVLRKSMMLSVSAACLAAWLAGCGKTDLSGYRLARDHAAETTPQSDSAKTNSTAQTDQPAPQTSLAGPEEVAAASAIVPVNVAETTSVRALMSVPADDLNLAPKTDVAPSSPATQGTETAKIEVLVKDKTFRADRKTGALKVTYDDLDLLRVLNMDQVTDDAVSLMPEWLRNLDGKTISLRGVMFPQFDSEGIERFVLARDSQACCFGPNARIYHLVDVTMKPGKTTNFIPHTRFFDVVGRFHIELSGQDGKQFGLYYIDQAEVIDR